MGLAELVAWVMVAVLIGWLGFVLLATLLQLDGEARAKRERRDR